MLQDEHLDPVQRIFRIDPAGQRIEQDGVLQRPDVAGHVALLVWLPTFENSSINHHAATCLVICHLTDHTGDQIILALWSDKYKRTIK